MSLDDDAERAEQIFRDAALAERKATATRLLPCGHCHYCDAPVRSDALFCDPNPRFPAESCARDYDTLQAARKRNGV
jgi:hypothetical protein